MSSCCYARTEKEQCSRLMYVIFLLIFGLFSGFCQCKWSKDGRGGGVLWVGETAFWSVLFARWRIFCPFVCYRSISNERVWTPQSVITSSLSNEKWLHSCPRLCRRHWCHSLVVFVVKVSKLAQSEVHASLVIESWAAHKTFSWMRTVQAKKFCTCCFVRNSHMGNIFFRFHGHDECAKILPLWPTNVWNLVAYKNVKDFYFISSIWICLAYNVEFPTFHNQIQTGHLFLGYMLVDIDISEVLLCSIQQAWCNVDKCACILRQQHSTRTKAIKRQLSEVWSGNGKKKTDYILKSPAQLDQSNLQRQITCATHHAMPTSLI